MALEVTIRDLSHSTITNEYVLRVLTTHYPIPVARAEFWHKGWNDTYRVYDSNDIVTHFVRISAAQKYWIRDETDCQAELDLLRYLNQNHLDVPRITVTRFGEESLWLGAPEGRRNLCVFEAAPGGPVPPGSALTLAPHAGRVMAELHQTLPRYGGPLRGHNWDVHALVSSPAAVILSRVQHLPVHSDTSRVVQAVSDELSTCASKLSRGVIHGDPNINNWVFQPKNAIATLLDFDHSGLGWAAYDVVSFTYGLNSATRMAFLNSYSENGGDPPSGRVAQVLEAARAIWLRGEILRLGDIWGSEWASHTDWSMWLAELDDILTT